MIRRYAAIFAALLAACQPAGQDSENQQADTGASAPSGERGLCAAQAIPISEVQGTGFASPLVGQAATVRGVVTLTARRGLFIQDPRPTSMGTASDGIFIASGEVAGTVTEGDLVTVRGTVEELGDGNDTMTALAGRLDHARCGEGPEPPEIDARLPRDDADRETLEAMLVRLDQALTVTAVRDVREGRIKISARNMLRAPTEIALPGPEAEAEARKNEHWSISVANDDLRDLDPYTKIQAGAVVNSVRGVLAHDGEKLSLLVDGELEFVPKPPPAIPEKADGAIRVVSLNLYEYFNGDGRGGGFPGERGADTAYAFRQQVERIMAGLKALQPDVLAVMELENDGYGPLSAVHHLRRQVSQALGAEFEVADPLAERTGPDVIAVGLLYRTDRVSPHGPARLLEGGSFGPLNRVPLVQVFDHPASEDRFVVVVNHLKSKGYCPETGPDTDQGDGQACWNPTRVEGARESLRRARDLATEANTDKLLLVGDFNAYRMEDPVRALLEEGLIELVEHNNPGMPHYSYIYRGAAGTLDYAFASETLTPNTFAAFIWHVNAAYPFSDRPSEPWLRHSDHDPVVVDLRFSQAATSD